MLTSLLGAPAMRVGDIGGIAVVATFVSGTRHADPSEVLESAANGGMTDAAALWILRHGLVHFLGRNAALYHERRLAQDRARGIARERLNEIARVLRAVAGVGDEIDVLDADLRRRAERALALVERASESAMNASVPAQLRRRYEEVWGSFKPQGARDRERLLFIAACRAAGLSRPYQAAMVASLERGPSAMFFGTGSRFLELASRRHALEYWRKAARDLDRLLRPRQHRPHARR